MAGKIRWFAVAFGMWALGWGTTSWGAEPIKIGLLVPVNHVVGKAQVNSAKMAVDEINAKGGVLGRKLQLIIEDTQINPEKGISGYRKLATDDKVAGVVGLYSSGVTLAVQEQMARYKVPLIGTASASISLTNRVKENPDKYKYYFRMMINELREADAMGDYVAKFLKPTLKLKRVGIMVENAKWTEMLMPQLRQKIKEAGIEIVAEETFDIKATDFSPIFAGLASKKVDFIVEVSAIADGVVYVKQWHDLQGPPIGGCNVNGMDGDFWVKTGGKCLTESTFILGAYDAPISPKTQTYWKNYQKLYKNTPNYPGGFTYDAIYVLASAIAQAKGTNPDALVKAIEQTKIVGATGNIAFQDDHDIKYGGKGDPMVLFVQWQKNGVRKIVYPPVFKNGSYVMPAWIK